MVYWVLEYMNLYKYFPKKSMIVRIIGLIVTDVKVLITILKIYPH